MGDLNRKAQRLSQITFQEAIYLIKQHPDLYTHTHIIHTWRQYIKSIDDPETHFQVIEDFILTYQDNEQILKNKFYIKVWLKYATKVKKPQDIYDYMIDNQIGFDYASTFKEISEYFESELMDFKKADKVFRVGRIYLFEEENEKQKEELDIHYERFCQRMMNRFKQEIKPYIEKINEKKECKMRSVKEQELIRKIHEKIYDNARRSFTKNQVYLGGIPIFVDDNFRDDVITKATQAVETYYDALKIIDCYDLDSQDYSTSNYFVKNLLQRRQEVEQQRQTKADSWLENQPFLKIKYTDPQQQEFNLDQLEKELDFVKQKKRKSFVIINPLFNKIQMTMKQEKSRISQSFTPNTKEQQNTANKENQKLTSTKNEIAKKKQSMSIIREVSSIDQSQAID